MEDRTETILCTVADTLRAEGRVASAGTLYAAAAELDHLRTQVAEMLTACQRVSLLADFVRENRINDAELRTELVELDHLFTRPCIAKAEGR